MTFPIRTLDQLGNDYVVVIDSWNFREKGLVLCYNNTKREHFLIATGVLKGRGNTVFTG